MNNNNHATSINPSIEPMIIPVEQESSTKARRFSANKIFAVSLFILLIILISYILFHGKVTDTKLSRLVDNANSKDIKQLLDEINHTLQSIEQLIAKTIASNVKT